LKSGKDREFTITPKPNVNPRRIPAGNPTT